MAFKLRICLHFIIKKGVKDNGPVWLKMFVMSYFDMLSKLVKG